MIVIIVVRWVVMSSQYEGLVFVVVVRRLFVFGQFKRANYIRSKTKKSNQWSYVCCRT